MKDQLSMDDYTYHLPEDRIAFHPLESRDQSKLLVFKKGVIQHSRFAQVVDHLNVESVLFFNDTKVIPARLRFHKQTGAGIEILLLSPHDPPLAHISMTALASCRWNCMIGNLKRWNHHLPLQKQSGGITLTAVLSNPDKSVVEFNWSPAGMTFAEVITALGDIPLPPYIQRDTIPSDLERYQTVYAHHQGAVAAPTAGLHFTDTVLESLRNKGIETDFVTLHVSAGTFLPIKQENALEHVMHEEQIVVTRQNITSLLSGRDVVAVGTTSMRTLESIYWYGCKLERNPDAEFEVGQEEPYNTKGLSLDISLQNVLKRMKSDDYLNGRTSIFIRPGYEFKVCNALITNFHQPGSTLLLLVAAFAGAKWKSIYDEALSKGYRFLSYGDSSLIYP